MTLTAEQIDAQIAALIAQRDQIIAANTSVENMRNRARRQVLKQDSLVAKAVAEVAQDKIVRVVSKVRKQRGMTYGGEDSGMQARIGTRGGVGFIHLTGTYNRKTVDITFKVGDTVEYDSYNLRYLGKIEKISEKRVVVNPRYGSGIKSMDLYSFAWRNYNFDLEQANAENIETSHHI